MPFGNSVVANRSAYTGTMFAGGVLSSLVLLSLLSILGAYIQVPLPPIHPNFANNAATGMLFRIAEMGAS